MYEHFSVLRVALSGGESKVSIYHKAAGQVVWQTHCYDGETAWCENMTPQAEALKEAEARCQLLNEALDPYHPRIYRAKSHAGLRLAQETPAETWDYGRYAVVIEWGNREVASVHVVEGKDAAETQAKAVALGHSLGKDVTWDWFDALSLYPKESEV